MSQSSFVPKAVILAAISYSLRQGAVLSVLTMALSSLDVTIAFIARFDEPLPCQTMSRLAASRIQ
jgi:hypothetical protein